MDKCPKCNGSGYVPTKVFGVNGYIKCDFCDGTGVFITNAVEPMTNEEWFSGMHTEAKAEWLADHMKCSKCPQQNLCNGYHGGCVALMLEWLKEKHDGNT